MDRGAWRATDHGLAKSWTRLRDYHFHLGMVGKQIMVVFADFYGINILTTMADFQTPKWKQLVYEFLKS